MVQMLRIHHWVKNILIFIPVLAAHKALDEALILNLLIAFSSFCLAASAGYIFNDLLDIQWDQQHLTKKKRPIAAGKVNKRTAYIVLSSCVVAAVAVAFKISLLFVVALLSYIAFSTAYSRFLKKIVYFDILALSVLYTVRIHAGAIASEVPVSLWLEMFSISIFINLASLKRFSELSITAVSHNKIPGRPYSREQLLLLKWIGALSGIASVVVVFLYTFSSQVLRYYQYPGRLILISVVLAFWLYRMWSAARHERMYSDPIVFAFKDIFSYVALGLVAFTIGWSL